MSEHFFRMTIWDGAALAADGTLESAVIDLRHAEIEYLELTLTPASSSADVEIQYCISTDGTTFNEYTDNVSITASTLTDYASTPNNTHHYLIPRHMFVKIRLSELASLETTVTGKLECSEVI